MSDAELSGRYFESTDHHGSGFLLELRTSHRFSVRSIGALFTRSDEEVGRGSWELRGDVLCLTPNVQKSPSMERLGTRLVPIRWNKIQYLIREDRVPDFCSRLNPLEQSLGAEASVEPGMVKSDGYEAPGLLQLNFVPERFAQHVGKRSL
jgi:hypothetical protein